MSQSKPIRVMIVDDHAPDPVLRQIASPIDHIDDTIISLGEDIVTTLRYRSMTDLAKYLESAERLREKVKTAMSYPAFILCFACLVVVGVVIFLIPKFEDMFSQAGAELPKKYQL